MNLDYEKRYKEVLKKASIAYKDEDKHLKATLERIFPELKESDDEQSKNWILDYLYDGLRKTDEQFKDEFKAAIDWIKRQGEKKSMWTDNDRVMAFTLLRDVDQMTYISDEGKNERLEWLNSLEDKFNSGE